MAQVNDLLVLGKANFLNEITSSQLLSAKGGIALSDTTAEDTALQFILGIKAFNNGGNVVWSRVSSVAEQIRLNASGTWGINISGTAAKATYVTLTDISTNGTYYLVSTGGTSGNQSLYTEGDTYYYYASSYSSLNVGKNTKNGIFTLHNSDHIANLQSATLTADVTHTFPATGGTVLNTGTTSWTAADTTTAKIGTLKLNGSNKVLYDMFMYQRGSELAANTDLNTLKTPSVYHSPDSTRSATLVNTPWKSSGYRVITMTGYSGTSTYGWQLVPASQHIFWRLLGSSNDNPSNWYSWIKFKYGTKVGDTNLPIYITAEGVPTAVTASSLFSSFTSSTNTLSITVAGQNRTASAVNSVANTWGAGTTNEGPSLTTTVNGVAGTAVRIPMATNAVCGATKVWKAADCTSYTDDTYTLTCAAVKKAFGLFNAVSSSALIGGEKLTTTTAVDAFLTANTIKWANADKTAVSWSNDGMLISIGWSASYGAQLWIDDGSGEGGMKLRNRGSTTTWNTWRSILTSLGGSLDEGKQLTRAGCSSSWYNGRDNAMLRQTTCSGYSPMISMKTTNGTWDIGSYNSSSWHDLLLFNYKSDTSYANGSSDNTVTHAFKLSNAGYLTLLSGFSVGGNSVINNGILTFTHSTAANQKITTSAGEMHYASASTIYIDSGSGSSLIFRPQGTEQARFNTSGKLQIKSTGDANATIIGPGTAGTFYFPNTGGTFVTHETRGTAVGSASLPVYIANTGRATVCTGSSVFSALSWTAGTSSGPVLKATIAGYARTATIPSASASASGIVTTGAQTFAGNKTFNGTTTLTTVAASAIHKMPIYWQHSGSRYGEIVVKNNAGTTIGGIISDCGNATTIKQHQWTFRSYSANATNDTATSGYYEDYKLPASSDGLTGSISYTVLTTKASSLTYQVGRLIATETQDAAYNAANKVALITGSPTGTHLEFDGNEIFAKTDGTTAGTLYLQSGSGTTEICGNATFKNTADGGFNFAGRIDVGCLLLTNTGWTGYGTADPNDAGITAVKGRVYFKLV